MINRGLQSYVCDIFGSDVWEETCTAAGLSYFHFEMMFTYDDQITENLLVHLAQQVNRKREDLLEDFGTYVVSEKRLHGVRDLLRFGGETYEEFLHSLEDIHDRARIALPDLEVPRFTMNDTGVAQYALAYEFEKTGFGAAFLGLLRAMADDYGTFVLIDHQQAQKSELPDETNSIDCGHFDISILDTGVGDTVKPHLVCG